VSGLDPGRVRVGFALTGGVVTDVSVRSIRPLSLASRFSGRPVEEAIEAVSLLHAVCGVSHAAALTFATAAATGRSLDTSELEHWHRRLAGERIGEHLRELARLAPVVALPLIRDALAAAHAIAHGGEGDLAPVAEALRLAPDWLPAVGRSTTPDGLDSSDDLAVVAALESDETFPALPHLAGRHPETGPASRLGLAAATAGAVDAARLSEAKAALDQLASSGAPSFDDGWLTAGLLRDSTGYASVESPRGRLYYLVEVQGDGRLRSARVVAPTEWNFHPEGPFARALAGFRPDGEPRAAVARLAAQFSPCVSVEIVPEGAADA
jgi:hypothetical protein